MTHRPYILLTRPEPQLFEDRTYFEAQGIPSLTLPLLRYETLPFSLPEDIQEYTLIATSMQPIRILAEALPPPIKSRITLYVVGEKSKELALSLGFQAVIAAAGTGKSLAERIVQDSSNNKTAHKYLYLRGEDISFDLATALRNHDLSCIETSVYKAHKTSIIPEDIRAHFQNGNIGAITLYSVRSAETLAALVRVHNLENALKSIHLLSLSANVLECVRMLPWAGTYIPAQPDSATLKTYAVELLKTL